ncbi:Myb-like_DNA-binding domain-containing protein [Hexamita inflata]|uniref:Myb-like_DNA-binding domain-containing protein n=1 Tax=Hexamita inflata TaxID=28002 RepID=A0ABP1HHV2_9EUKA
MKKISWSQSEINKLTIITENNRKFDKKVDWDYIAAQIPTRTASQCKSYYANVLKKTLDVQIRQNHKWNRVEIIMLWEYGTVYNKDYVLIQKNFIPNLSVKQISSQFIQIQQKQEEMQLIFKHILKNRSFIETISDSQFRMQWWIVRMVCRRLSMMSTPPNPNYTIFHEMNKSLPPSNFPVVDISEKVAIDAFFMKIDPFDLIPIYLNEEKWRGFENEEFYVPNNEGSFADKLHKF